MQKVLSFVLLVLLTLSIGCKKDDSSTNGPVAAGATIPTVTFKGPAASEAHAQTANSYAQSMNGLMSSSSAFSGMPATTNGNVSTWSYNAGTYTWTFTGTKQSDGSYTWTWTVNGTVGSQTYNNWTYWSGTTSADGKSGSWSFYENGSTRAVEDLNYSTAANGTMTGTWNIYNTNGALAGKFIIINNTDNSGEFTMYADGTHLYEKVTWTATGTGSWWMYNAAGTTATSTGTF